MLSLCSRLGIAGILISLALSVLIPAQAQHVLLIVRQELIPDKELYDVKQSVTIIVEAKNLMKDKWSYQLEFITSLEDRLWSLRLDGELLTSPQEKFSLEIPKHVEKISITLIGTTPDWGYLFKIPFLVIRAPELAEEYLFPLNIERYVGTPEAHQIYLKISRADSMIQSAESEVNRAEALGLDVSESLMKLDLSKSLRNEAERLAKKGELGLADSKLEHAISLAREAQQLAAAKLGGIQVASAIYTWAPILIIAFIVILMIWLRFRRWERL